MPTSLDDAIALLPLTPVPGGFPGADGLPTVTHAGVFVVGGHGLKVYQLSDGRRVIDADDVHRFFGTDDLTDLLPRRGAER